MIKHIVHLVWLIDRIMQFDYMKGGVYDLQKMRH